MTTTPQLASTNRSKVGLYVEQAGAFGALPTSPTIFNLRVNSNSLKPGVTTEMTDEIRADGQVVDVILTATEASGDIAFDLSFNLLDPLLEAVLGGTWANAPSIVNTGSATPISAVSTTALTVAAGGAAFVAGMLTLTSGMPTAANNKLAPVVSSTSTGVTYAASTFTAETAAIPTAAAVRVVGFQGASGDIVATTTGLTSTVLDFTTLGLNVGQWVVVGDPDTVGYAFATAANLGRARISAIAAHVLTFDEVPTGWTADTGTGKTIRVFYGDFLVNGTVNRSFGIEIQQQDLATPLYEYYTGIFADQIKVTLEAKKKITASLTIKGSNYFGLTARVSDATDVAAPTYSVMNASSNVGRMAIANSTSAYLMKNDITLNANGIVAAAIGSLAPIDIVRGEMAVSGSIDAYLLDPSILTALYANTAFSQDLKFGRQDGNRESYVIDLPRCKYTTAESPVSGKNQIRMVSGGYQAIRDPVKGYTASVERNWYLPAGNN